MKTLDDFIESFTEEERHTITLSEAWNAAVRATTEMLLEEGFIDDSTRYDRWVAAINKILVKEG